MVHFKIDDFLDLIKYWSLYCVSDNSYLRSLCESNFGIFFFLSMGSLMVLCLLVYFLIMNSELVLFGTFLHEYLDTWVT